MPEDHKPAVVTLAENLRKQAEDAGFPQVVIYIGTDPNEAGECFVGIAVSAEPDFMMQAAKSLKHRVHTEPRHSAENN